ncbi:hypothetical protein [Actinomadura meyerae]|nr:hypothetical protein [Actinomadura meyerae]
MTWGDEKFEVLGLQQADRDLMSGTLERRGRRNAAGDVAAFDHIA